MNEESGLTIFTKSSPLRKLLALIFVLKKVRLLLLLFAVFSGFALQATAQNQLIYSLQPTYPEKGSRLIVKLELQTLSQKSTQLFVPTIWGDNRASEVFKSLKIKGGKLSVSADSSEITIAHAPGQKIYLTYVFSDPNDLDSAFTDETIYEPAIRKDFLTFFTNSVLFAVKDEVHPYSDCTINVKAIERMHGAVVSSFGKPDKNGNLYLKNVRNEEVQNGILVSGDYRITETTTKTGQRVTLAIRGKWAFTDEELEQLIQSTIDQQRTFWNDFSQPTFLITVSPIQVQNDYGYSMSGTGLHHSFAVNATNGSFTTIGNLAYLFNHELMHHWIGGTILNAADEELSYWFSEGFTDYFTRVNMLESGLIDHAGYLELTDSIFRSHYADKRMNSHNDSIRVHFWDDSYIGKLPYNRGSLFALLLDAHIRKATDGKDGLKTVMQQLLAAAKANESGARQFHRNWLEKEVNSVSGLDIAPWIDRYIIAGEIIPMELYNEALPQKLTEKRCKVFGFGFSLELDDKGAKKILEVFPDTGAAEADFKPGDIIRGYDVYMQPDSESRILVDRNGQEIWIPFHPYEWRIVPQFEK